MPTDESTSPTHATLSVQALKQRTKSYALRILDVFNTLPRNADAQVIGSHLVESGMTVGAAYHTALRTATTSELILKLSLCIQRLEESIYWMELLIESQMIPEATLTGLINETNQLSAIFAANIERLTSGSEPPAPPEPPAQG